MEKFNFKFERILGYKRNMESYKKSQYGKIQQQLTQEQKTLKNHYDCKNELKKKKNESCIKTNIANLQLYNNYLTDMDKTIATQEEVIYQTKDELEAIKRELLEIVKEKKTFEKLKEKKHEEHLYSMKKEEEKLIDTIVSFKANTQ